MRLGALAIYMAEHYGVKVRAYNISHEQVAFARERARAQGLAGRVEFIEEDYRAITGKCDAFVSVGMLEHVGTQNYRALGGVIDRCLSGSGPGADPLDRPEPADADERLDRRADFPRRVHAVAGADERDLRALFVFDPRRRKPPAALRPDAGALARAVRGPPRRACRRCSTPASTGCWRLYLAGSLAAFTTGWMQLFQVVFSRPLSNDVPETREHLYAPRGS